MTDSKENGKSSGNATKLRDSRARANSEALKVFLDNPKMAVTVVSFVTSAGAIIYRLALSAKEPATEGSPWWDSLTAILFSVGLVMSLISIILSYRMIGTITACYLDLVDDEIDNQEAEQSWLSIRLNESPTADNVMYAAVAIWAVVIFLSAFSI